jgi:hypothetical protein
VDGDDGVVHVELAAEERLDLDLLDEGPEPVEGLAEVLIDVLALELEERVQIADETVEAGEVRQPGLQGALLLQDRGRLPVIVPELWSRGGAGDLLEAGFQAGFVKGSSEVRGP